MTAVPLPRCRAIGTFSCRRQHPQRHSGESRIDRMDVGPAPTNPDGANSQTEHQRPNPLKRHPGRHEVSDPGSTHDRKRMMPFARNAPRPSRRPLSRPPQDEVQTIVPRRTSFLKETQVPREARPASAPPQGAICEHGETLPHQRHAVKEFFPNAIH